MSDTPMSAALKDALEIAEIAHEITPLGLPAPQEVGDNDYEFRAPQPFKKLEVVSDVPEIENSDLKDDYIEARNITYTLVEMTGRVLQGSMDVALESQHPKAYDSFNALANTMRGIAKDLIEHQKIYKDIIRDSAKANKAVYNITQNNTNIEKQTKVESTSLTDILKALDEQDDKVVSEQ